LDRPSSVSVQPLADETDKTKKPLPLFLFLVQDLKFLQQIMQKFARIADPVAKKGFRQQNRNLLLSE